MKFIGQEGRTFGDLGGNKWQFLTFKNSVGRGEKRSGKLEQNPQERGFVIHLFGSPLVRGKTSRGCITSCFCIVNEHAVA